MITVCKPMMARLLAVTFILLDAVIFIHDGHVDSLSLQLKVGTILQPLESVNSMALVVVRVVSKRTANGFTASPSGLVVSVKAGVHSFMLRTHSVEGKGTIVPLEEMY